MSVRACPFCKEVYTVKEAVDCPVCGLRLGPLSVATDDAGAQGSVLLATVPITDMRYGRAWLLLASLSGIVFFLMPWVREVFPYQVDLSGFDIAQRTMAGWMWGPLGAWMVLQSVVLSRKSRFDMLRARMACAVLAVVPIAAAYMIHAHPPTDDAIGMRIAWGWGLWAEAGAGVFAFVMALRFGKERMWK